MGRLEDQITTILKDLDPDDEIESAIQEGINFEELVREALAEDSEVKTAFREFVARVITSWDPDDDQSVTEQIDVAAKVKRLLDPNEGDPRLRETLEAKVKSLLETQIDNLEDDEAVGDTINDAIGELDLQPIAKRLLTEDAEVVAALEERVKGALTSRIEGQDDSADDPIAEAMDELLSGQLREQIQSLALTAINRSPDLLEKLVAAEVERCLQKNELFARTIEDALAANQTLVRLNSRAVEEICASLAFQSRWQGLVQRAMTGGDGFDGTILTQLAGAVAWRMAQNLLGSPDRVR